MPHSRTFPEHCPHQIPKMSQKKPGDLWFWYRKLTQPIWWFGLSIGLLAEIFLDIPSPSQYPSVDDCFHGIFFQNLPRNLPDHALACSFKTAERNNNHIFTHRISSFATAVQADSAFECLCQALCHFFPFFSVKRIIFSNIPQNLNVSTSYAVRTSK